MKGISEKLYIIIVEDNEMDSTMLESKLKERQEYETKIYTKTESLFDYLELPDNKADVIIFDEGMSLGKTEQVLTTIRKKNPLTEVVLLSDNTKKEKAQTGAYASVPKDRNAIEKLFIILENIKSNKKLKREKIDFETKANRRQTSIVTLLFILALIFACAIYFIFFR